jgi:16S rRNA (guanine966-N2)-methyltransferase
VESDPRVFRVLEKNAASLGATDRCALYREDALSFLARTAGRSAEPAGGAPAYDVAFADPPYRSHFATQLAGLWLKAPFAAIFGVEHESSEVLPQGGDTRRYGDTSVTIYRT